MNYVQVKSKLNKLQLQFQVALKSAWGRNINDRENKWPPLEIRTGDFGVTSHTRYHQANTALFVFLSVIISWLWKVRAGRKTVTVFSTPTRWRFFTSHSVREQQGVSTGAHKSD